MTGSRTPCGTDGPGAGVVSRVMVYEPGLGGGVSGPGPRRVDIVTTGGIPTIFSRELGDGGDTSEAGNDRPTDPDCTTDNCSHTKLGAGRSP